MQFSLSWLFLDIFFDFAFVCSFIRSSRRRGSPRVDMRTSLKLESTVALWWSAVFPAFTGFHHMIEANFPFKWKQLKLNSKNKNDSVKLEDDGSEIVSLWVYIRIYQLKVSLTHLEMFDPKQKPSVNLEHVKEKWSLSPNQVQTIKWANWEHQ